MSTTAPPGLLRDVPLSLRTTLEVGGAARWLVDAQHADDVATAVQWARAERLPVAILGGGSNTLVADGGFPGLVIHPSDHSMTLDEHGDFAVVSVGAGHPWTALVDALVERGFAGIAPLAGIPGLCGAAPIQNVGAYGVEVADLFVSATVLDLATGEVREVGPAEAAFGYRSSRWKHRPGEELVLNLRLRVPRPMASLRHGELRAALGGDGDARSIREATLGLRRAKSMVHDVADANHRSAGSFFLNPEVANEQAMRISDALSGTGTMPQWPTGAATVKLSAAWLIERCGFARGWGRGRVGLSTNHCLAIVNRGGATAAEVVAFALEIREGVEARSGVRLVPEVHRLGFERDPFGG